MPATLIIQGDADTIIPVSEAKDLDAILTKAGRPHEMHLYPGVEHGFNFHGLSDWYNRDAADDAWRRTVEFLDRTLESPSGSPSTLGEGAGGRG
jgi:carboxymethylenebutenolidase